MRKVQVCRPHDLGEQGCQDLAQELLDKLVDKFGGTYAPSGQNYTYRHTSGVTASVEPRSDELVVNVKLGLMARAFAPKLESEMNKVLDKYLA